MISLSLKMKTCILSLWYTSTISGSFSITVGSVDVSSAGEATDLGVWFDLKLTMSTHIDKTCGAAFFYLYNIRHIRKFPSKESTETLIHAFITNCNSLFFSLPNHLMLKLQGKRMCSLALFCT